MPKFSEKIMTIVVDPIISILTTKQIAILSLVYETGFCNSTKEYADKLKTVKPVITNSLNKLENLGLIERVKEQKDRRKIIVLPTDKGFDIAKRLFN